MDPQSSVTPAARIARILKLTAPMWAPWLLIATSYQLGTVFPGTVKIAHWKTFSSACFLVAGAIVVVMTWRSGKTVAAKAGISAVVVPVFLFIALMLSVRSRCGDEPAFIGHQANQAALSSCSQ
jgi:hypothetical protein